jgi:hypothetical protein
MKKFLSRLWDLFEEVGRARASQFLKDRGYY